MHGTISIPHLGGDWCRQAALISSATQVAYRCHLRSFSDSGIEQTELNPWFLNVYFPGFCVIILAKRKFPLFIISLALHCWSSKFHQYHTMHGTVCSQGSTAWSRNPWTRPVLYHPVRRRERMKASMSICEESYKPMLIPSHRIYIPWRIRCWNRHWYPEDAIFLFSLWHWIKCLPDNPIFHR